MPDTPDHKTQLRNAYAMRAAFYAQMFDVMREELGLEKAMEIGREATRRLGEAMGRNYAAHGPADLQGLCSAFLNGIPNREDMFAPEITRLDGDRLEIHFHRCPLKEAWQAQGRSDEDVQLLCRMAGAIDAGLFTTAGFTFKGTTWEPGREGCCHLVVEPGPDA